MASFRRRSQQEIPVAAKIGELTSSNAAIGPFIGIPEKPCRQECWHVAFSPDESHFAWVCENKKIILVPWNRLGNCLKSQNPVERAGKSPVVIDCVSSIQAIAFGKGTTLDELSAAKQYWTRFDFTKDWTLATGHSNGRIRIWDIETGKLLLEMMDHREAVKDLAYAPDGSLRLVSASADHTLKVWDLKDDGNMVKTMKGHSRAVLWCVWSPDAKLLASTGAGKIVYLWDMSKYTLQRKLEGHLNDVVSCAFSPDGAILATASWDTKVILWDPQAGEILKILCHVFPPPRPIFAAGANNRWVRGVSYNKTGDFISTIADDGLVRFWNVLGDEDPEAIAVTNNEMVCCNFSPSGQCLAVGFGDCGVYFYSSPRSVPRLLHLSRVAIRKRVMSEQVSQLEVPNVLKKYLRYQLWD